MSFLKQLFWGLAIPLIIGVIFLQSDVLYFTCNKLEPKCFKTLKPAFGFCPSHKSTYAMVKPGSVTFSHFQTILNAIKDDDELYLKRSQKVWLKKEAVEELYSEHFSRPFFKDLVFYISSGPVIIMELKGKDSIARWRKLIGPTDPSVAKLEAPYTLRAKIGFSKTMNSVHGSDSELSAKRELDLMFSKKSILEVFDLPSPGYNYTLLIIQPSIIDSKLEILKRLELHGLSVYHGAFVNLSDILSSHEVSQYFDLKEHSATNPKTSSVIESGESLALIMRQENAIDVLLELKRGYGIYKLDDDSSRLFGIHGSEVLAVQNYNAFRALIPLLFSENTDNLLLELNIS